jgi:hypothetical protein
VRRRVDPDQRKALNCADVLPYRPRMREWACAACALLVLLVAAPAIADETAAAEAEFVRARKLLADGKTGEACQAFTNSQRLDPQMGTLYNLALCHDKVGKLASAWKAFRELAQRDGNARRRRDAARRADELTPRLTSLLVTMPAATPGLVVTSNGEDITRLIGIATPVDPETYEIVARAPDRADFRATVRVTGEGMTITVAIPALEPSPPVIARPAPRVAAPSVADADIVEHEPPPRTEPRSSRRTIALAVGGTGVAVTAVGAYFGVRAYGKWSDAEDACGGDAVCATPEDLARSRELTEQSRTAGNVATAMIGVGAAAVVGGTVLWLWPSRDAGDEHALRVVPGVDGRGARVSIQGRF